MWAFIIQIVYENCIFYFHFCFCIDSISLSLLSRSLISLSHLRLWIVCSLSSSTSAIEPKGDLACPIGFIPEEAFIISNPLIKFFLFFGSSAISSILFGTSLAILMKDLPILLVKALKEELSIFINFSFSLIIFRWYYFPQSFLFFSGY